MTLPIPLDEREGFIFFNNKFIPWKEAKIHVLTHGLHYGSSCFEGVRIYNGKIFKNLEHAERLLFSASCMDFTNFLTPFTAKEIADICDETCKKNNILNGYIRPIFWRGSEQLQVSAPDTKINFAVAAWSWPNYSEAKKKEGLKLLIGLYKRPSHESGPVFAKVGGFYVSPTLIKHDAEKQGFDDCLMLDYRNYIAECSTSNFFAVFGNEIHTPIPDCFLNGITRQTVIELAKNLGYKVIERHMELNELANATDAFSTGTASEITRIASVTLRDLNVKYEFKESSVSIHLLEEYKRLVLL